MENWQVALLTVSAVLIGALVPAIIQFQITMRHLDRTLERTGESLRRALHQATDLTARIDRITATVEGKSASLESFLSAVGGASESIERLRSSVGLISTIGAAIAPAVSAAVSALRPEDEPNNGAPHQTSSFVVPEDAEPNGSLSHEEE
jgi:uncharacterized protein YoxC